MKIVQKFKSYTLDGQLLAMSEFNLKWNMCMKFKIIKFYFETKKST